MGQAAKAVEFYQHRWLDSKMYYFEPISVSIVPETTGR